METAISDSDSLRPATLLAIAATLILVWGTAYTMVSVAVREIEPIWLVAGRTALAAILLIAYAKFKGRKFPSLTDTRWLWYGSMGLTGIVLPFFLFAVAQKTVDSGICAIIGSGMPLITIILAHFFAGERLTWRKLIGFVVGFAGIIILFLPDDLSLALVSDWKAQLMALGAAAFYAVTTIAAKRAPETPPSVAAAMMVSCAAIIAAIWALFSGMPAQTPSALTLAMIVGLGIGSTGFANILYLTVVQKSGPSTIARINYFPAVVSVVAGVWILNEDFTWRIVFAFAVVLLGVMFSRSGKKDLPLKPL